MQSSTSVMYVTPCGVISEDKTNNLGLVEVSALGENDLFYSARPLLADDDGEVTVVQAASKEEPMLHTLVKYDRLTRTMGVLAERDGIKHLWRYVWFKGEWIRSYEPLLKGNAAQLCFDLLPGITKQKTARI